MYADQSFNDSDLRNLKKLKMVFSHVSEHFTSFWTKNSIYMSFSKNNPKFLIGFILRGILFERNYGNHPGSMLAVDPQAVWYSGSDFLNGKYTVQIFSRPE